MRGKPLEFCTHHARAARAGTKTVTWKPLSPADQERRLLGYNDTPGPFIVGYTAQVMEPWGYVNGAVAFASSFVSDIATDPSNYPLGWKLMPGVRSERTATITAVSMRRLSTLTEEEAVLAGTPPPNGSTWLAEYQRQWNNTYRGTQAWGANPLCWRVTFALNAVDP